AGCGHCCVLVFGGALATADDGSGVAHAAAWRRGLSGDETDDRFFYVGLNEFGGALFGIAADFADEDDGVGFGIVVEHSNGFEEGSADDGVAADADAGGLADAEAGELVDGFIRESAAATDYADVALFMDAAGHDADFAFAGGDDAGAVGADEARFFVVDDEGDANHVEDGNAFGDANDQGEFGLGGFENGVGGKGRRNENDGSVCAGPVHRIGNGVEYRSL